MIALPFLLGAALAAAPSPAAIAVAALDRAAQSGDRVVVQSLPQPGAGCAVDRAEVAPLRAGGRVAVRFEGLDAHGRACSRAVFAQIRLLRSAPRLLRAVDAGEQVGREDVAWEELDVRAGRPPLSAIPEGAAASRRLAAGTVLEASHVRVGPSPGTKVTVVLSTGALTVEREGRVVPCSDGAVCAALDNGRRVSGELRDGRLQVVR